MPAECLPSLRQLIARCWAPKPAVRPSFPEIVDALENLIIECAIEDEFGRQMWKTYFLRKDQVLWHEEFVPIFAQYLGKKFTNPTNPTEFADQIAKLLQELPYKCLGALLAEKKDNTHYVNLEKFGQVLGWFGPFKDPDGRIRILERIENTLKSPWFHGSILYDDAVNRLKSKDAGTFLVRFSSKENPNCFTISKVTSKNKIVHSRIVKKSHNQEVSTTEGKTFANLFELIEKSRDTLKLITPCPETPYLYLFTQSGNADLLYGDFDNDD